MLFDWFTIIAQVLNFLILVWLLQHFLYKPILHAIDQREKKVSAELADADAKKDQAKKQSDDFTQKNDEFDKQRAALLKKATDDANTESQRLIKEAGAAADALAATRQKALENDAENLRNSISDRIQQEVFTITKKTLSDLATTSLEERMADVFVRRLQAMDGPAKAALGDALKKETDPALIRSAFDLPAEQQKSIQDALNKTFSAEIHIRFETAPKLVSGIELDISGQKLAWTIADYLASLEKGVGDLVKKS